MLPPLLQGSGTQVTREMETQVLITALALPYGGKILFAATETGVVRCYKYPLTGMMKAHSAVLTLRLNIMPPTAFGGWVQGLPCLSNS